MSIMRLRPMKGSLEPSENVLYIAGIQKQFETHNVATIKEGTFVAETAEIISLSVGPTVTLS